MSEIRMKDVAKLANVSTATVSYVLNNTAQVSDKTRIRVLHAVDQLKYQRNTIAKTLRTRKSATIGVMVEDITVFNAPGLIDGINAFTDEVGYHIILSNLRLNLRLHHDYKRLPGYQDLISEAVSVLLSRQIDGMIYIGEHTRDVTDLIAAAGTPCVYTYCYTRNADDCSINYDDRRAAFDAVSYLIDTGHRRIATVTGLADSMPARQRLKGYRQALEANGLVYDEALVAEADWESPSARECAAQLLGADDRPTAIFAMNDLMAVGAIEAAMQLGLSVPEDVSIFGFDNREFGAFHRPKLTTMDLPLHGMGERSAQVLLELIRGRKPAERAIWMPCTIVERESTAPRKDSRKERSR